MTIIGTPLRLQEEGELADLLLQTATLPEGVYKGGVFIYTVTVENDVRKFYYLVSSAKPYTIRRVLRGDASDRWEAPVKFLERMPLAHLQGYVEMTKSTYRSLARYARPSEDGQSDQGGQVLRFRGVAEVA